MFPAPRIVRVGRRDLAVEDGGPQAGFPVMVHNGAGSRHLFAPAVAEGRDLGFRLIGYDRPGCGGSTAMPGRVVADCAADVQAIMSELGIVKMAAWGSSGGGPYALATAAQLPEAVTAVCVFASIGPYGLPGLDFTDGLGGTSFPSPMPAGWPTASRTSRPTFLPTRITPTSRKTTAQRRLPG